MPCHAILNQRARISGSIAALLANPAMLDLVAKAIAQLFGEPLAISSVKENTPTHWGQVYINYLTTRQISQPWPTSSIDTSEGVDISSSRGCIRIQPDGTLHMRGGHNVSNYYSQAESEQLLAQIQPLVQQFTALAVQSLIAQRLRSVGQVESIGFANGVTTITLNL
jgi:hypothetical protein